MKKYQLGILTVKDQELQDTREELVIEFVDQMQKYTVEAQKAFEDAGLSDAEKLERIESISNRLCGLIEFLENQLGIEVRSENGMLYPQELYYRIHYWKQLLELAL